MFNFNRKEKGQGLVEYALILVLIAIVVIVAMQVLGDKVSDTFGTVNSGLSADGSGGSSSPTAVPTTPSNPNISVTFNCSASGSVDVKNMSGGPNGASFTCSSGSSYTYTSSDFPSGTVLQFRNMFSPYTTLADYTVP